MPGCIVPGCTSGYKSNFEKVHFFCVPKDSELKEKWQTAMKRSKTLVPKTQVVCANHFLSKDIIRKRHLLSPEGHILGVSPYQRPRLAAEAVPCIFPWTEEIPSDNEEDSCIEPRIVTEDAIESPEHRLDTQEDEYIIGDSIATCENFSFTVLAASTVTLPALWNRNDITYGTQSLISFFLLACEMIDGKYHSYNLKEVIVDTNLQLHTHVMQKPLMDSIYITVKHSVTNPEELEEYIRNVHGLRVCQGLKISEVTAVTTIALYRDKENVNRSDKCTLLCLSRQCNKCQKAKIALFRKLKRDDMRSQDINPEDKMPSDLNESEKIYIRNLKRRLNRCLQQKKKLRLEIRMLKGNFKSSEDQE